jgi:hypothetical protein
LVSAAAGHQFEGSPPWWTPTALANLKKQRIARERARRCRTAEYMPIEQQHLDRSRDRRDRLLSPGFSLGWHLAVFGALAAGGVGTAAWLLRAARPRDLWIVPAYLVVANLVEYGVHRVLMHRPLWPRALYRGHTLGHHRAFHHHSMAITSWRELELVMMPWFTILLFFTGMGPLVALVARCWGRGAAGAFLLTGVASFVLYEGLHALYHLPVDRLARLGLAESRLFGFLYRHHRHHHRLARMRWVNFNISCPFADRLLGTFEDERAWQRDRDQHVTARGDRRPRSPDTDADPPAPRRRSSSGAG